MNERTAALWLWRVPAVIYQSGFLVASVSRVLFILGLNLKSMVKHSLYVWAHTRQLWLHDAVSMYVKDPSLGHCSFPFTLLPCQLFPNLIRSFCRLYTIWRYQSCTHYSISSVVCYQWSLRVSCRINSVHFPTIGSCGNPSTRVPFDFRFSWAITIHSSRISRYG